MKDNERILKPLPQRKPKESVLYPGLIDLVVRKTKYRKDDVKIVVDCLLDTIAESLEKKKSVKLPKVGIIFPTIKRSRVGTAFNRGVGKPFKMVVPDMWLVRFQSAKDLDRKLCKLPVSEKELDLLYKD
jgi:nucleoid DNA-binding protein